MIDWQTWAAPAITGVIVGGVSWLLQRKTNADLRRDALADRKEDREWNEAQRAKDRIQQQQDDSVTRINAYRERQLNELYTPLVMILGEISHESIMRNAAVTAVTMEYRDRDNYEEVITRLLEYEDSQFFHKLIPLYEQIEKLIQTKGALAEPELLTEWHNLAAYLNKWRRHIGVPGLMVYSLVAEERSVEPLYAHIESKFRELYEAHKISAFTRADERFTLPGFSVLRTVGSKLEANILKNISVFNAVHVRPLEPRDVPPIETIIFDDEYDQSLDHGPNDKEVEV